MTPRHHLSEELLLAYAAGSLPEPVALFVACHLTLCPLCRAREAELSAIGGVLLDSLEGEGDPEAGLDAMMALLDVPEAPRPLTPPPQAPALLPAPLRAYIPSLDWQPVAPGRMWNIPLPMKLGGVTCRLLRLAGGVVVPPHTHEGVELIQVFSGGYKDRGEQHLRGDVAINDHSDSHSVLIDPDEDCIFLYVSSAPLRATTDAGRGVMGFLSR